MGEHDELWKDFCLRVTNFSLGGPLGLRRKFVLNVFIHSRASGYTIISHDCFCLSTETLGRRTLLCFRKIIESKNFEEKKGGDANHVFPSKLLCPTVPKQFVEELIRFAGSFRYRERLWIR